MAGSDLISGGNIEPRGLEAMDALTSFAIKQGLARLSIDQGLPHELGWRAQSRPAG